MSRRTLRVVGWGLALAVAAGTMIYAKRFRDRTLAKIAYMDRGSEAAHMVNLEAAEKAYREALKIDPKYLPARIGLADVYSSQGAEDKALRELRRAVELDRRNYETHLALAHQCLEYRRYPDAIAALRRAVALTPRDPRLRLLLVHAYRWNGEPEQARKELAVLEELDPGSLAARQARLAMERQQKKAQTSTPTKPPAAKGDVDQP